VILNWKHCSEQLEDNTKVAREQNTTDRLQFLRKIQDWILKSKNIYFVFLYNIWCIKKDKKASTLDKDSSII